MKFLLQLLLTSFLSLSIIASEKKDSSNTEFCKVFNKWLLAYENQPIKSSRISVNDGPNNTIDLSNWNIINNHETSVFSLDGCTESRCYVFNQDKIDFIDNCKACNSFLTPEDVEKFETTLKILECYSLQEFLKQAIMHKNKYQYNAEQVDKMLDEAIALNDTIEQYQKTLRK